MNDAFNGIYRRGLAVGESDVRSDQMHFRYREELFSFPTHAVVDCMHFNGYFYTARVRDLRKLNKAKH